MKTNIELNLLKTVDRLFPAAKQTADYITDHPEVSGQEKSSAREYSRVLQEHDYHVISDYLGVPHSFFAKSKRTAEKRAALLVEYDALPQVGHACGHSLSGAASLLAFLTLENSNDASLYSVDLIGTPGEEATGGKIQLLERGAFDDYDFAAMVHMDSINSSCFRTLACNDRYFTFTGKSSHASAEPEQGINALNAARLYMDAMDMWRQHLPSGVQFHGVIEKGGVAPNIVPDQAILDYYFRARSMADLRKVNEIAENCARAAALAMNAGIQFEQRYPTYADLFLPESSEKLLDSIFKDLNLPIDPSGGSAGSTDAGNIDQVIPVFHPTVTITAGKKIPLHHQDFEKLMKQDAGYQGMRNAAKLLVLLVSRLSMQQELFDEIRQQHDEHRSKSNSKPHE